MRVIIAGSRTVTDFMQVVEAVVKSGFDVTTVISGTAKGVDQLGEDYAELFGLDVERFPADWSQHGRAAGPIRNRAMAEAADALVAVWDGSSRGTKNMIETARKLGLAVHVHRV